MLDLKAKLAAAGVVTKEQVESFEAKQADEERAREARRKAKQSGAKQGRQSGGRNAEQGRRGKGKGKGPSSGRPAAKKERPIVNVEHWKTLNRGEVYDRLRKVVAQRRLDQAEKTVPGPDDKPFSFVTAKGSIGRLYLSDPIADELRHGRAAISAFMSHHGLAHCVLPKDIALDVAKIFPLWLRFHHGNADAGQLEAEQVADESASSEQA